MNIRVACGAGSPAADLAETRRQSITADSALRRCACCAPRSWGRPWELGSASFWLHLAAETPPRGHRLGRCLTEEVVACMLGGFGVPGEVGVAAFEAVAGSGILRAGHRRRADNVPTVEQIAAVLSRPLKVPGRVRPVRYRFWRQRSARLAGALALLREWSGNADTDPALAPDATAMRARLTRIPGVGMKTASWVVRNYLDSDDVAIIDIHVARAGTVAGVFCAQWTLPGDYLRFESAFLTWSRAGQVRASMLDAVIWRTLADLGRCGDALFGQPRTSVTG